MADACICCTVFLAAPEAQLIDVYEENAEPADGYLIRLGDAQLLVDALATETADWARQVELAGLMTGEDLTAISLFLVGAQWGLALNHGTRPAIMAAYDAEAPKLLDQLPRQLLAFERTLEDLYPGEVDGDALDALFGAMLESALPIEEAFNTLLSQLGCPPDWLRWSWYETIPQQLFLDPDLADRVQPLGRTREFWEE